MPPATKTGGGGNFPDESFDKVVTVEVASVGAGARLHQELPNLGLRALS